ncbi:MAG: hypothetical protein OXN84_06275 [Albidovulum sp.]|nr:hypothetical protein [Albidovulum sp.]
MERNINGPFSILRRRYPFSSATAETTLRLLLALVADAKVLADALEASPDD